MSLLTFSGLNLGFKLMIIYKKDSLSLLIIKGNLMKENQITLMT